MKNLLSSIFVISLLVGCDNRDNRPNIIWIVADDLGTDLGCYGEKAVHTPNLDQFASTATQYTQFTTVTAVCSPSRSTLMTGMYPTAINTHQHRTQFKSALPKGVLPLTHFFREKGYFTSNGSFEDRTKPGKQDYNFIADSLFDGTDWSQRAEDQPFFAQIQVSYPHRPFQRDIDHPVDPDNITVLPFYPDHDITRADWAQYLEFIQLLDQEVGKILDRIDREGLSENTYVLFFGDQGRPHVRAKQFLYEGGVKTPLLIRSPRPEGSISDRLISNVDIATSTLALAGIDIPNHMNGINFLGENERQYSYSMRDRRDETVDRIRSLRTKKYKYIKNFYPERPYTQFNAYKKRHYPVLTLMQEMQSKGQLTPEQSLFFSETRPQEELYDLESDPYELNNLIDSTNYLEIVDKFRIAMDSTLKHFDKGIYPEDPKEIQYAEELMKKRYKSNMEKIGLSEHSTNEEILAYWTHYLSTHD